MMRRLDNSIVQKYEQYLSPFGKKVLKNLVNNIEESNKLGKSRMTYRSHSNETKRTLLCNDFDTLLPATSILGRNELSDKSHNGHNNNIFCNNSAIDLPTIQTSDELLKTVEENIRINQINVPSRKVEQHGYPRIEQKNDCVVENPVTDTYIEWDDMIDLQLLHDLNILDNDTNINADRSVESTSQKITLGVSRNKSPDNIQTENNLKPGSEALPGVLNASDILKNIENLPIHNNFETKRINEAIYPDNNLVTAIPKKIDSIKKAKTKRQNPTKITEIIPKKVKKPAKEVKNTFRKQKYTKSVRNWLNDIDTENFEDLTDQQNPLVIEKETSEVKPKDKKTVQAQLTNKGGVMKFGKPKLTAEVKKQIDSDISSKTTASAAKEKKVKPKFIAPIKSELPAKDINYMINNINNDITADFEKDFLVLKDSEINMVLVFSNGFCQLNSHYTDDRCVVEGVMFHVNENIYYWNGVHKKFWTVLQNIITRNTIICYGGKNLLKYFLTQHGMDIIGTKINILDAEIGGHLLHPDNPPETFADLQKVLDFSAEYTTATDCALQQCAWYLTTLGGCFRKLSALLVDNELMEVFVEIEMRVLPIIAEMEARGVPVDTQRLRAMEAALALRMRASEQACHAAAGRVFQVNSPLQVRAILYDELRLDARSNVQIRETICKGDKSTSEAMLRSLTSIHPLPGLILEYRQLHKAHATFLAGIANQVKDGVVRPTWVQTAAATGRIACSNPNLQAIPKTPLSLMQLTTNIAGTESDIGGGCGEVQLRAAYAARAGRALLAADYKHIECRVFAHAAADAGLLAALRSPDLFRVLAARWLAKPEAGVSREDRERTKRIVYASLYGAGARRLAHILDVRYDQALSVAASFHGAFPSLKSFGRAVAGSCARGGGRLRSLRGRTRTLADIASDDCAAKAHAERQAVNFIVQGSAADLCKMAMVVTTERLRAAVPPARAHLLLQIHDELVWEVDEQDLERAAVIIKASMESVGYSCGMEMALPVSMSRGRSWGEMVEFEPNASP